MTTSGVDASTPGARPPTADPVRPRATERPLPAAPVLPAVLAGCTAVLVTAALTLAALNGVSLPQALRDFFVATVTASVSLTAVGLLIARSRPELRLGWLLLVTGLACAIPPLTAQYARFALVTHPGSLPAGGPAAWLAAWTWPVGYALLFVAIPLSFPDGRLPRRPWRHARTAGVVGALSLMVGSALSPGANPDLPEVANPYAVQPGAGRAVVTALATGGSLLLVAALVTAFASLIDRYRRAAATERLQLRLFLLAVGLLVVGELGIPLGSVATGGPVDNGLLALSEAAVAPWLAAAIGVAVLRHGLYDIDVYVNRAFVYAVLTAGVVAGYVLIVSYLAAALQMHSTLASLVATGVVAVLFQPARERVQRAVNRLLYGHRGEPFAVLAALGRRLESGRTPAVVLTAIAQTVREGLRVPYVRVELSQADGEGGSAESGAASPVAVTLPLVFGDASVGTLAVASRRPGEPFDRADLVLMQEFARHAGVAAYAARVADQLQSARQQLVEAREQERRRLRRDLHDGFGAQLASQTLVLDAARSLVHAEPARADELLVQVRDQTQQIVAALRELISDLRPPLLDDRGLLAALRGEVERYAATGLAVTLEAPASLPQLPAAVEVALLRIAGEALVNCRRHAGATSCRVSLTSSDREVRLDVVDDGRGLPADYRPGVGLLSMRERSAELGGRCDLHAAQPHGTRVSVRLPRTVRT